MIDWRICAAMCNFTHQKITSDGELSRQVAERMVETQINKTANPAHLDLFLRAHLNNTTSLPVSQLNNLTDFPRLDENQLKNEVFFGSYHSRMAQSYLKEFLEAGRIYKFNTNRNNQTQNPEMRRKIDELRNSGDKIIGVKVAPRHKRSENNENNAIMLDNFRIQYKVFLQYRPNQNNPQGIISKYYKSIFF